MERIRREPLFLDLVLYGVSAAFAVYTAVWSTLPAHRFWGVMAVGGYLPAALLAAMFMRRYAVPVVTRVWIAVGASVAVTLMPLVAEVVQRAQGTPGRAQDEVLVIEDSGVRLWETGTPYLSTEAIEQLPIPLLGYNPYQPGMALFGLPRAWAGQHWFTDARIYFAIATLAAIWAALRLLTRAGMTRSVWIRGVQAVFVLPICALTLTTGGDDLPVLALCLLAMAALATDRPLAAGLAVGAAAALKLFAWPVLVVLLFLAIRRHHTVRYLAPALLVPLATLTPTLLTHAGEFVANVVSYPLGHGVVKSTAASPLPGYLIANNVPGGRYIALGLLAAAAIGIGIYLLRRSPASAHTAAAICAFGLLIAMTLMPASRFGYLLYPAAFGIWWWVLRETEAPTSIWNVKSIKDADLRGARMPG